MAEGTQVRENSQFIDVTTEETQLQIFIQRDGEHSSEVTMKVDFEETQEDKKMLDSNCDQMGVTMVAGNSGGGEMHSDPNDKLSIKPMASNVIIDNPLETLAEASISSLHGHYASCEGEINNLKERLGELEHQMESLQWDVRSSITCQV